MSERVAAEVCERACTIRLRELCTKPSNTARVELLPEVEPEEDEAEPGEERDVVEAGERCGVYAEPEERPGARYAVRDVSREKSGNAEDEVRRLETQEEGGEHDGDADEVKDPKDDVSRREEEPGYRGDDKPVAEDGSSPPEILPGERGFVEPPARPGVADSERDADEEDERRCREVGDHPPEPARDVHGSDAEKVQIEDRVEEDHRDDGDAAGCVDLPVSPGNRCLGHGSVKMRPAVSRRRIGGTIGVHRSPAPAPRSADCRSGRIHRTRCTREQ